MSESQFVLPTAPIVEAVVDIDCDLPPNVDIEALDIAGKAAYGDRYPRAQRRMFNAHRAVMVLGLPPQVTSSEGWQAHQYLSDDRKQLVQVRPNGFSFNRLAPYTSLDDYLPEIERTWRLFVQIASPTQIRSVRLRFINRILLPIRGDSLQLDDYLKVGPHLPDEKRLTFTGFLNQHSAVEKATGNQVIILLATQPSDAGKLPLIFDINTVREGPAEPDNWAWLLQAIASLRALKNSVFQNTLTEWDRRCRRAGRRSPFPAARA